MRLIDRILDPSQPPVLVAELSGNHGQSFETAKRIIRAAAEAGADAVKLQTYTADSITLDSDRPEFVAQEGLWKGQRLHALYQKACTPYAWHRPLADFAAELGIPLFSAPFDEAAVDFLEETLDPPLYKIASFELTHVPLLERVAQTGKPVILSSGMASEEEVAEAVATLRRPGGAPIVLLKCVSAYPSQPEGFNLRSMQALAARFGCPVGLSDHTLTNEVAIAAVALGARVIEKHLTDARAAGGIDAGFSLEPEEFAQLAVQIRRTHAALGSPAIQATLQDESEKRYRRSIYASRAIALGELFTPDNIRVVRPAFGLPPKRWRDLLGRRATRDIREGSPLEPRDIPDASGSEG